jgi:uncharacterized membrane protein YbhN (UPF0104 family)
VTITSTGRTPSAASVRPAARTATTATTETASAASRATVEPAEPAEPVEPAARRGVRRSVIELILLAVGGAVAAVLLSIQLRGVDVGSLLGRVEPWWAAATALLIGVTFVGAAWNVMGFAPQGLRLVPTVLAQVASGFAKVMSPSLVGSAMVNARYLQRSGVSTPGAIAAVGMAQVVQFLVTVGFLAGLVSLPAASGTSPWYRPGSSGLIVVTVLMVAAGVAWSASRMSSRADALVRRALGRARREGRALVRHARERPGQVTLGVFGSVVLTGAFVLGLGASLRAFGGGTDLLTLTVVFLTASAAGSVIPSPGGLGTVEAALVTGLVGVGQAPEVALPAVLWFRLLSVWAPVPLGWLALGMLRRRALL